MKTLTIPFSGFYESLHKDEIDQAEQQMFSDRDTGCQRNEGLEMALFYKCDYRQVYAAYAKEYCGNFSDKFELGLTFDELVSPREYNFTTDRIFAFVPDATILMLWQQVDKDELQADIKAKHSSRDGFFSFYANSLEAWPDDVMDWDHNQLSTLLACWVGEFDIYEEYSLMEDDRGNGLYDRLICDATPGIERLFKIHDYLEQRAAR